MVLNFVFWMWVAKIMKIWTSQKFPTIRYFQTQIRVVKGRGGICIIQWLRIDAIEVQTTSTQTQIWTFGQFCGFVGFGEPRNETRVCCVHITHVAVLDKIHYIRVF